MLVCRVVVVVRGVAISYTHPAHALIVHDDALPLGDDVVVVPVGRSRADLAFFCV